MYAQFIGYSGLFLLSIILTGLVRVYATKKNIIDIPNERSSHTNATPRGGGLSIVITFMLGFIILLLKGYVSIRLGWALIGGSIIVSWVGWFDDKKGISVKTRLICHLFAAAWALYWLNGLQYLNIGLLNIKLGFVGTALAMLGIVWMINLYNFMDGIDGIASIEVIMVVVFTGILQSINGSSMLNWILAVAVAGFLPWNWTPAKIFMGDIGSGFLGFTLAVLAIFSEKTGTLPLIIWIIMLGVFVTDATATLVRRISLREKWYEAHCSHVYQLAVQRGYTHGQVTLTVAFINLALALVSWSAFQLKSWMLFIFIINMIILFFVHNRIKGIFNKKLNDISQIKDINPTLWLREISVTDDLQK